MHENFFSICTRFHSRLLNESRSATFRFRFAFNVQIQFGVGFAVVIFHVTFVGSTVSFGRILDEKSTSVIVLRIIPENRLYTLRTLISRTSSYVSLSSGIHFILNRDDSFTCAESLNQVTIGAGLARHLHFMVIRVPLSFGIIFGFSMKVGASPSEASSSPPLWQ